MGARLQDIFNAVVKFVAVLWQTIDANPVLKYGILLAIVAVVFFKLLSWAFAPMSTREKLEEQRRNILRGHAVVRDNPSNGMVLTLDNYPWVMHLVEVGGQESGWMVKTSPHQSYLIWGGEYIDFLSIGQIAPKEVEDIEKTFRLGQESFTLRGAFWEVIRKLTVSVKVLKGTPSYFPGKVGVFDFVFVVRSGPDGDAEDVKVIENPHIPNKPTKLVTWTFLDANAITEEEFLAKAGKLLAPYVELVSA